MRSKLLTIALLAICFTLVSSLVFGATIYVPGDFDVIQDAIDNAQDGDFIEVAPGTYYETINFNGLDVTVYGNPGHPEETVIDADRNGVAVTFENGETNDAMLKGFTIQNGLNTTGAGISCWNSSPTLEDLIVRDCYAYSEEGSLGYGGGILCWGASMPIRNVQLLYNTSDLSGGGLCVVLSYVSLEHVSYYQNGSSIGGAIFTDESYLDMDHNTVFRNYADIAGGLYVGYATEAYLVNSIFWDNTGDFDFDEQYNGIDVRYCDVQDEWEGEGNISVDPDFVNPDNGNMHLNAESPCIDAGDPFRAYDPDGTVADMGAFYFHQWPDGEPWAVQIKASAGFYHDNDNFAGGDPQGTDGFDAGLDLPNPPEQPDEWIDVYFPHPEWDNPLGDKFSSDIRGVDEWFNNFPEYYFEVDVGMEYEEVELEFRLTGEFPEDAYVFLVDFENEEWQNCRRYRRKTIEVNGGSPRGFVLFIGTGGLDYWYEADPGWHLIAPPGLADDMSPQALYGDDLNGAVPLYGYHRARGYEAVDECKLGYGYWLGVYEQTDIITEAYAYLQRYERQINLGINMIGSVFPFPYPFELMEFRYGGGWNSFEDAVTDEVISPVILGYYRGEGEGYYEAEAFDPTTGYWLFCSERDVRMRHNFEWPFWLFEGEGEGRLEPGPARDDNEGWMTTITAAFGDRSDNLTRFGYHPDASDDYDFRYDTPEPPMPPGDNGVSAYFVHDDWSDVFGSKYNTDIRSYESDGVWEMTVRTASEGEVTISWEYPEVESGNFRLYDTVEEEWVDMTDDATYTYNSTGRRIFRIEGGLLSTPPDDNSTLPTDYSISSIAPNPFNPETVISYTVPAESEISISVFDVTGRQVASIFNGKSSAGVHHITWDGANLAAGQYMIKYIHPDGSSVRKAILLK